ncbi:MAG: hypothetical protein QM736_02820 [Vicinamibacterales bacterium]
MRERLFQRRVLRTARPPSLHGVGDTPCKRCVAHGVGEVVIVGRHGRSKSDATRIDPSRVEVAQIPEERTAQRHVEPRHTLHIVLVYVPRHETQRGRIVVRRIEPFVRCGCEHLYRIARS